MEPKTSILVQPFPRWSHISIVLPPMFNSQKLTRKPSVYEPITIEGDDAEEIVEWLEKNFFAKKIGDAPFAESNPINQSDLDSPGIRRQNKIIEFLTKSSKEQIMGVPGIGSKKSDEIIEQRAHGLTWDKVSSMLNNLQIKSLINIIESEA